MKLIFLLFIFICGSAAQYYESPSDRYPGTSVLADPIRRALGLWGRLLNRMAQPNAPSDEQLRLQNLFKEGNNIEALRNNQNFFGTGQNTLPLFSGGSLGSSGNFPNEIDVRTNKIIDEKKLLELLPRLRETTSPSTITISEATKTTESSTTIKPEIEKKKKKKVDSINKKKKEENVKNNKKNDSKTEDITSLTTSKVEEDEEEEETTTTTIVPPTTKKTKKTKGKGKGKNATNKELNDNKSKSIINSTISIEASTKMPDNNVENITTTTKAAKSFETVKKDAEKIISEIEEVLNEEQWILTTKNSSDSTVSTNDEVKANNNTNKIDNTKIKTKSFFNKKLKSNATEKTLKVFNNKNINLNSNNITIKNQNFTKDLENNIDNDLLEDGSGEELILTITTTKSTTQKPKSLKKKFSIQTTMAQKTTTTKTTESSPVKHEEQRDYDEDDDNDENDDEELEQNKNITKDKIETETTSLKPAFTKARPTLRKSSKHKTIKNSRTTGIPEAEEEDLRSANNTQKQLDSAVSVVGPSASLKSAANSLTSFASVIDPISSVVPVKYANSIIDGIGPLILPILGYSRHAVSQFLPRRTQGVSLYQPEKHQNNYDQYSEQQKIFSQLEQKNQRNIPSNYYYHNQQKIVTPSFQNEPHQQNENFLANSGQPIHIPKLLTASNGQQLVPISSANVKMSAQDLDLNHLRFTSNSDTAVPEPKNLVYRNNNAKIATQGNGVHRRFMSTPLPTIFASDAYRQALSSYLNQPKVVLPTTQNIATNAFRQMYEINKQKTQNANNRLYGQAETFYSNEYNKNSFDTKQTQQRNSTSSKDPNDPGYDQGRSDVVNTFYENSGVMVNDQSPALDSGVMVNDDQSRASDSGTFLQNNNIFVPQSRSSSSGFGGGRRPDIPFDD